VILGVVDYVALMGEVYMPAVLFGLGIPREVVFIYFSKSKSYTSSSYLTAFENSRPSHVFYRFH